VFWLGILLLMAFSFNLRWFPVSGAEGWNSLVLPAITLALPTAGLLTQVLREAMEKTLDQPFVTTVRSRGVGEFVIRWRHVLRHALLPAVTLGGWLIGGLLGGAVITEKVFGRPGLGTVTLGAVLTHDVPVVLTVVLLAAFIHVAASTLLDILYVLIDPRLRAQ
jgi:peptide/nickel transport system permease protein